MIKQICAGFIVGVANIIPGVSGGTLLFLLGLYERTLGAINKFNADSITALLRHACGTVFSNRRKDNFDRLVKQARDLDIPFLVCLVGGAGLAILLLSGVMEFLLEKQFSNTFAFFFGLIAISVVMALKMLKVKKPVFLIHAILGAAITVAVTAAVDPAISAGIKSERYRMIVEAEEEAEIRSIIADISNKEDGSSDAADGSSDESTDGSSVAANNAAAPIDGVAKSSDARFKYTGLYSPAEFVTGAIAGAIAISAMILPGLSGSLVLILLGKYHEVISAISGLKSLQLDYAAFLTIMALGMIFGLLAFARVIDFVLKRWYDGTISFLIGLMVGSLYALWPFKEAVMMDQYVKVGGEIRLIEDAIVLTNINIPPEGVTAAVLALVFCAVGAGVMIVLERYSAAKPGGA